MVFWVLLGINLLIAFALPVLFPPVWQLRMEVRGTSATLTVDGRTIAKFTTGFREAGGILLAVGSEDYQGWQATNYLPAARPSPVRWDNVTITNLLTGQPIVQENFSAGLPRGWIWRGNWRVDNRGRLVCGSGTAFFPGNWQDVAVEADVWGGTRRIEIGTRAITPSEALVWLWNVTDRGQLQIREGLMWLLTEPANEPDGLTPAICKKILWRLIPQYQTGVALLTALSLGMLLLRRISISNVQANGGYGLRAAQLTREQGFFHHRWLPPVVSAVAFFGALVVVGWQAHQFLPQMPDEVVYHYQARTLLAGRLSNPVVNYDIQSYQFLLLEDGAFFGKYPPVFPAALALGIAVGAPWLVNLLALTGTLGLFWAIAQRLYDRPTAAIAAILFASSPFTLGIGPAYLSHQLDLLLLLAFTWWYLSRHDRP